MARPYNLPVFYWKIAKSSVGNVVLCGKVGTAIDNGIILHLEAKTSFCYKLRTNKAKLYSNYVLMRLSTMITFTVPGIIKLSL